MSQGRTEDQQTSYRVGFRASSGLIVPAVLQVQIMEGGFMLQVTKADRIEAVIEIAKDLSSEFTGVVAADDSLASC